MKSLLGLKHNALDVEVFIMAKTFKLNKAMQSKDLKTAALAYAEFGLPVLPIYGVDEDGECLCGKRDCDTIGKHPIISGGFKNATSDIEQVDEWWSEHPQANIGSPLVQGLFVLDFDGEKGQKSFEKLGLEGFETLRAKSGKGFHLYTHSNLKVRNGAMSGLDIRGGGEGGYIIMPPSRHATGNRYKWEI